jgi:hypothetical protein
MSIYNFYEDLMEVILEYLTSDLYNKWDNFISNYSTILILNKYSKEIKDRTYNYNYLSLSILNDIINELNPNYLIEEKIQEMPNKKSRSDTITNNKQTVLTLFLTTFIKGGIVTLNIEHSKSSIKPLILFNKLTYNKTIDYKSIIPYLFGTVEIWNNYYNDEITSNMLKVQGMFIDCLCFITKLKSLLSPDVNWNKVNPVILIENPDYKDVINDRYSTINRNITLTNENKAYNRELKKYSNFLMFYFS